MSPRAADHAAGGAGEGAGAGLHVVHVMVRGRVQGVGYRAWCAREAQARGLQGWVRNRASGTVEAVFSGDALAVEAMVAACRQGPYAARVDELLAHLASDAALAARREATGFSVLETL